MKELLEEVYACNAKELERAKAKFGDKYNSLHEAYAVMLEEISEARDEMDKVIEDADYMFRCIRINEVELFCSYCASIHNAALNLASEAIQVAAVCDKAYETTKIEVTEADNDDDSN